VAQRRNGRLAVSLAVSIVANGADPFLLKHKLVFQPRGRVPVQL